MKPIFTPLPFKNFDVEISELNKRVLFFDPAPCYANYTAIDVYTRINPRRVEMAFPVLNNGICSCGCGAKLTGRQRRWAKEDCSKFAIRVVDIMAGISDTIRKQLVRYNGGEFCCNCGSEAENREFKNGLCVSTIHVDHIIPVHKGGGGCWLNNYQLLCVDCHKKKTREDYKTKTAAEAAV